MKIELQLNDAQAVASFISAIPEVRKAIEDALPALKTMFADAGLDLRQADVGSGNTPSGQTGQFRQPGHFQQASDSHALQGQSADTVGLTVRSMSPAMRASNRLLDTFA